MAARTGGEVSLSGTVVEIIPFRSSHDRSGVLKVRDAEKKIRTVVGVVDGIEVGDYVVVTGIERQHPHHGLQVRATTLRTEYPREKDAAAEWMMRHLNMQRSRAEFIISEWCHGVAPGAVSGQLALLWEAAHSNNVGLVHDAADLFRDNGHGPEWTNLVAYAEKKAVMDDLVELGLDTKEAFIIFQALGTRSAEKVRFDPYTVYYYVETTPFEKVDKIYLRRPETLKTDDRRVRALCVQRVRDFVENGDTAVRYDDLIDLLEEKHDYIKARVLLENLHGLEPEMLTFYYAETQGVLVQPVELARFEDGFARWLVTGEHPENKKKVADLPEGTAEEYDDE